MTAGPGYSNTFSGMLNAGEPYDYLERWIMTSIDSTGVVNQTGGETITFRLTAIPEPSSLGVVAAGGLAIARRRRGRPRPARS